MGRRGGRGSSPQEVRGGLSFGVPAVFVASARASLFVDAEPVLVFQTQLKPHLQLLAALSPALPQIRFQDWGSTPTLSRLFSCGAYCLVILPVYASVSPTRL